MTDARFLEFLRALQDASGVTDLRTVGDTLGQEPPSRERDALQGMLRALRTRSAARN
jgi:hypothetical protein